MAKDIRECLLEQAGKFHQWQEITYPGKTTEEIGGVWEVCLLYTSETLDEAVCGINDLQEEFDENDSEIETVARECIAATVACILEWFGIPIDTEEAIRERDW